MSYRRCLLAAALTLAHGCFPETQRPTRSMDVAPDRTQLEAIDDPSTDPVRVVEISARAVLGVVPSHGTYLGGNVVLLRGNGFGSAARVWFGEAEVPERDVISIDAQRIQVTVPEGSGEVDVHVQDADDTSSRSTLVDGYRYDPFLVEPARGITRGGSTITLLGRGTRWNEDSEVTIDLAPCEVSDFREQAGIQILVCKTPPGTEGAKNVEVTTSSEGVDRVLGAFTYANAVEVLRGGLDGEPLDDELTVVVLSSSSSQGLDGASVAVGDGTTPGVSTTDAQGVVQFSGSLGPAQTVTVAAPCHHPLTFVDVPVSQVVAILDPTLTPECTPEGDPPAVPTGTLAPVATITGQLVWPKVEEFRTGGWGNLPVPQRESERRVAYVFEMSASSRATFALPRATQGVTSLGTPDPGYPFVHGSSVGNLSLYALAGIEDRTQTPPRFTPFVMGLTRGVSVAPHEVRSEVFIRMDILLERRLDLELVPPNASERGPHRIDTDVRVRVGAEGHVLLPATTQSSPADAPSTTSVLGLPALSGLLADASYVVRSTASSGAVGTVPTSALVEFVTSSHVGTTVLDGFVEIPRLESPSENGLWNGHTLILGGAGGGTPPDLRIIDIALAGGRMMWRVVAPGEATEIELPRLSGADLPLPKGEASALVQGARLPDFDYGSLSQAELDPSRWVAHAADLFFFRN